MHIRAHRFFMPKFKARLVLVGVVFVLLGLLFFVSRLVTALGGYGVTPENVFRLMFSGGVALDEKDGRTNILLLGTGGDGHEGGDLTDSMIILSLQTSDKTMALVSVPRDIWSDTLKDKVNTAYHYGEVKQHGGGLMLVKVISEEITGIPIHYSLIFDFSVFSDAVDLVGGIDVDVPVGFTDPKYPIAGKENDSCGGDPEVSCRYKTISFEKGIHHMDGPRALEYVRSRHSDGAEGSDFSRTRRQQDVLLAIRAKAVNPVKWFGILEKRKLLREIQKKAKTDMDVSEMLTYGKLMSSVDVSTIKKISIDDMFTNPSDEIYDGKYVLIPKGGYDEVHAFISDSIGQDVRKK
jgi:LCP family protein required for cell wall assembly